MFCAATVTCCTLSKVDSSMSWQCAASSSNAFRWDQSVPASSISTVFTIAAAAMVLLSRACKKTRKSLETGSFDGNAVAVATLQHNSQDDVLTQPQLQLGTWQWFLLQVSGAAANSLEHL